MKKAGRTSNDGTARRTHRDLAAHAATESKQHMSGERAKAVMDERARALSCAAAETVGTKRTIEVICFMLGDERYGIEASCVREVARFTHITPIPGTPEFLMGVTNLRGDIVAVMDLRRFFAVAARDLSDQSRLIVLGADQAEFGIVADSIVGVSRLTEDAFAEPPESISGVGREYLRGVTQDGLVLLDGRMLVQDERLFVDDRLNP